MEPNQAGQGPSVVNNIAANPAPQSFPPSPKNNSGLKIGLVLMTLIALCGIGFGVYTMMDSNKKTEQLNNQIEALKKQKDELQAKIDGGAGESSSEGSSSSSVSETSNYIYIGEWGIKVKKPENWRELVKEYTFYNDYPHAADTFSIVNNADSPTAHASIIKISVPCKDANMGYSLCFEIKGEAFVVSQLPPAETGKISESFRAWVTNTENYSAI